MELRGFVTERVMMMMMMHDKEEEDEEQKEEGRLRSIDEAGQHCWVCCW